MAIKVTSKKDGFRRCGIEHVGTVVYPNGRFTRDEIKRLKAEPMLIVEDVPESAAAEGKK